MKRSRVAEEQGPSVCVCVRIFEGTFFVCGSKGKPKGKSGEVS